MYDFLFVIIELFSLVLTVETLQAEICRCERFLKGAGHFDRPLTVDGDVAYQPLLGSRKLEGKDCPFMWYENVAGGFFGLVTKHACVRQTEGRTDGQNYDSQDRASIYSCVARIKNDTVTL